MAALTMMRKMVLAVTGTDGLEGAEPGRALAEYGQNLTPDLLGVASGLTSGWAVSAGEDIRAATGRLARHVLRALLSFTQVDAPEGVRVDPARASARGCPRLFLTIPASRAPVFGHDGPGDVLPGKVTTARQWNCASRTGRGHRGVPSTAIRRSGGLLRLVLGRGLARTG
ncbi:hypothetical protein [Streptomyces rubradiris]|uniref:Uncharacterized protein n=1 Tax=Streptomyces rubradiris TaxID=285531 RepID=A0ABQ3R8F0_STRRR|nr:hypothetical protein [Streptomyces rubradiris]GHH23069.1 hypothetical protein GCM10018792_59310 [Streptomyces rubradiris]GHI52111.1 hypothetical protein Srubr_19570 [Streptomyces rubradiris]